MSMLDASDSANPRADGDTDAIGIFLGDFNTGILESLATRRDAIMDEDIHLFGFLLADVIGDVEMADAAANAAGKLGNVENLDGTNPASSIQYALPGFNHGQPYR